MESKFLLAVFLAVALTINLASATSTALDTSANQELTPVEAVGYLRSKRQFYPGYGGSNAFSSAQASAVSGGGGYGFPGSGGFSAANAVASSGAQPFGFGK